MQVDVRNNNLERALKTLRRKLNDDGMFRKLQEKQSFEKPSDKRRRIAKAAEARQRRADRERNNQN